MTRSMRAVIPEAMRRSPLQGRGTRDLPDWADLWVREIRFLSQTNLRVLPESSAAAAVAGVLGEALPTRPNTWTAARGRILVWLGPDEWLIVGPPEPPDATAERLRA